MHAHRRGLCTRRTPARSARKFFLLVYRLNRSPMNWCEARRGFAFPIPSDVSLTQRHKTAQTPKCKLTSSTRRTRYDRPDRITDYSAHDRSFGEGRLCGTWLSTKRASLRQLDSTLMAGASQSLSNPRSNRRIKVTLARARAPRRVLSSFTPTKQHRYPPPLR